MTGNGTTIISDLASGNYQITITDNNNCQNSAAFLTRKLIYIYFTEYYISDYNGFNVKVLWW